MNYYTAKANIRMNLIETIGNSSVNYLDYPELKSGGKTREIAERNVEREAAELIGNTLLYRLLYQHIIQ
jgi:carbon monoxide dehydrogenase subunit G